MTSHNARKYIAVAYAIIAAILLLITRIIGLREWGDVFSLGQLLVDAVLLPVAIIGFVMAMEEFRKAQAIPELSLYWETESGEIAKELKLKIPSNGGKSEHIHLALRNEGRAVGLWYLLNFKIPDELSQRGSSEMGHPPILLIPKLGKKESDHWQLPPTGASQEEYSFKFMSKGQLAAYPGDKLSLAEVVVFLYADQKYSESYKIYYTAFTDRGQPREDFLTLCLVR